MTEVHELDGRPEEEARARMAGFPYDRLFLRDALSRCRGNLLGPTATSSRTVFLRNPSRQVHFLSGDVDVAFALACAETLRPETWGACISLPSDRWRDALAQHSDLFYFDTPMITFTEPKPGPGADRAIAVARLEKRHVEQIAPEGWPSPDTFIRDSVGFGVVRDGKVASYAISNFPPDDRMEMAVGTAPEYRRQGLGYAASAALLSLCRDRDIAPQWTSWSGNEAACALARKLGFGREVEHHWAFIRPVNSKANDA